MLQFPIILLILKNNNNNIIVFIGLMGIVSWAPNQHIKMISERSRDTALEFMKWVFLLLWKWLWKCYWGKSININHVKYFYEQHLKKRLINVKLD